MSEYTPVTCTVGGLVQTVKYSKLARSDSSMRSSIVTMRQSVSGVIGNRIRFYLRQSLITDNVTFGGEHAKDIRVPNTQ